MAKYFFVARNVEGEIKRGETVASEEREVVEDLKKEGYWVTSIRAIHEKKQIKANFSGRFLSVPLKNKMIFCRHLAVMIASGLPLSKSLNILATQEKNKNFKGVINKVAEDIKQGISFADAIAKYPAVFNTVFVSMVRVGEVSGNLEEILKVLSDQLEKDHKLIAKIKGAMIYPAIIFGVMVAMGILMMMFVVPKITAIFSDFDADLPPLTQLLITVSDFMANNVFLTLGAIAGSIIAIKVFSKTAPGVRMFHLFYLKAPVVGPIVTKVNSARFSRILSSLLESGVALVESLNITADTLGNYYFKKAATQASKDVQKGIPLSQVLLVYRKVFPYLVIQMVEVGEETGRTNEVLLKLASFYEEEVDQITKNLSSIIEPVLMVVIGTVVGLFAISIIQPIYSIMGKM